MLGRSFLKEQSLKGLLSTQSMLRPEKAAKKKSMIFSIMLTSLVDAFCILVIFLLTNATNSGQPLDWKGKYQLPGATQSEALGFGTVVKIQGSGSSLTYSVDNKQISIGNLVKELISITNKENLIVQADRGTSYEALNPIILAAAHAGFEHFQFAVLPTQVVSK